MVIDGYCTLGTEREAAIAPVRLLAAMDAAGINAAVIGPDDREMAVYNRAGNDRLLDAARRHPRFIPTCTVNPWFGEEGYAELRRAAAAGARLLVLHPALQGFLPNDNELLDPLVRVAAEVMMTVYVHTGPHTGGSPAQVAFLALRHPDVTFLLGHGGTTDHAADMRPVSELQLPNLWIELSYARPWGAPALIVSFGAERVVFGSGFPRNPLPFELRQFDRVWPIAKHPDTYGGNLARLLGLNAETLA